MVTRLPHCPNPQVVFHSARGEFEVCTCVDPADRRAPVHWMDSQHGPMYCHCGPRWQPGDILIWDGNHYGYYCRTCGRRDDGSGRLLVADFTCCSCGGPALKGLGFRLYRHIAPVR